LQRYKLLLKKEKYELRIVIYELNFVPLRTENDKREQE